jgi:hypothetical protein
MLRKLAVAFAFVAVLAGLSTVNAAATTTPKTALVYGDSISFESRFAITNEITLHVGWTVATHTYPGTAPCDWIPWLATDLVTYHPSIVSVETAGNWTRPCMVDATGAPLSPGTPAYYSRITADLSTMFQMITATGARAEFIDGPPMQDKAWNLRIKTIDADALALAKSLHQISIAGNPRVAVSASGAYTAYKTCFADETAAMGCTGGKIAIRTITGAETGIHFCPDGLGDSYPYVCDMYSSGEFRFGRSLARSLTNPPKPRLP